MAFPRRIQSIVKAYFWQNQVLRALSNSTEMQSHSNFCSRSHLTSWVMLQRTDLATLTAESQYRGFSPAPVFPKVSMGRCLYSSCLSLCRTTKFSPELNFKLQGGSGFQFQFKKNIAKMPFRLAVWVCPAPDTIYGLDPPVKPECPLRKLSFCTSGMYCVRCPMGDTGWPGNP